VLFFIFNKFTYMLAVTTGMMKVKMNKIKANLGMPMITQSK